jgi:hypothetical protein
MSDLLYYTPQAIDLDHWLDLDIDCVPAAARADNAAKSPDDWKHIAESSQRKKVQNRNAQKTYSKPGHEQSFEPSTLKRRRTQA